MSWEGFTEAEGSEKRDGVLLRPLVPGVQAAAWGCWVAFFGGEQGFECPRKVAWFPLQPPLWVDRGRRPRA